MRRSLACLVIALAACSSSKSSTSSSTDATSSGAGAGTSSASASSSGASSSSTSSSSVASSSQAASSSSSSGAGGSGGSGGAGTGGSGGGSVIAEVFGHSPDTLYKLDPITKNVTTVGPFQGLNGDSMIDIAIDMSGKMYGTAFGGFYSVDKSNANCKLIAQGGYPNSLSFVPKGTVDPNVEALVGYSGSTYVRIDTMTGAISNIGALAGGYASSGDIVSVINGGTYLTVTGNNCNDCIVEVDPKTGDFKKLIGALGHSGVYGLAFWAGDAYGFDASGQVFQIDLTNGATTPIMLMGILVSTFYGAGSTTASPLGP